MRIFFLLFVLLVNIYASNTKQYLILNNYISENNIEYKDYIDINFNKKTFEKLYMKMTLNKEMLNHNTFYLKVYCDTQSIVFSNIKFESTFDYIVYKLDKNSPKELLLNFKFQKEKALRFGLTKYSEFEYKYILKKESLLYGIAYGIIFCAFLYNFIIFLYSYQKSFLYYSLMQLFLIIALYYTIVIETQTFITQTQQIITDFFETACLLLMILFSKEILNTRKTLKTADKVLNFLIYLSIIDLISIFILYYSLLYTYLPRSLIIVFLVILGLLAVYKGQKVAIFYFMGWIVVLICIFIEEYDFFDINPIYIVHIGLPLESLILSFALGYKLKMSMDEKREKEKMLIQQTKLASMGEMLNNIAHQWRQPLTNLSFINMDLKMANDSKDITNKYLDQIVNDSSKQIDFMSDTLDNLKGFYQPNKKKDTFNISKAVYNVINIIEPILEKENIKLEFKIIKDKKVLSYENEYSQVVLNLLTNAKDVLLERNIQNPYIKILLEIDVDKKSILTVSDNAKGIPKEIIQKIFNPYFSTKHKNSGIGLYMTKIIIESHLKGEILVSNTLEGASFKVII